MRKKNLTKAVETTVAPNPKEVDIWVEPKDDDTVSLKYYDYHDNEWKGGDSDSNEELNIAGQILMYYNDGSSYYKPSYFNSKGILWDNSNSYYGASAIEFVNATDEMATYKNINRAQHEGSQQPSISFSVPWHSTVEFTGDDGQMTTATPVYQEDLKERYYTIYPNGYLFDENGFQIKLTFKPGSYFGDPSYSYTYRFYGETVY